MSSTWLSAVVFASSIAVGMLLAGKHRGEEASAGNVDTRTGRDVNVDVLSAKANAEGALIQNRNGIKRSSRGRQTLEDEMHDGALTVQSIGTVQSIYRLCVGTPRQGLLAPHARGRIVLDRLDVGSGIEACEGLEGFSHIWIVFVFHLNTLQKGKHGRASCKIAPPALGGKKVGVLATRSPHRFNPVGITLARLDGIRTINACQAQGKNRAMVCLDVSGLDLVHGTPVLDIKPYVGTYDAPGANDSVRVPPWVAGGLASKRLVYIAEPARRELQQIVRRSALEFYGRNATESPEQAYENVSKCIEEVLSMDVRSVYQTAKARQGKSQAERAERLQYVALSLSTPPAVTPSHAENAEEIASHSSNTCTQQIDNLMIHFDIRKTQHVHRTSSEGRYVHKTH
jgi:tRNA (adenine37-N6)-methyltransferase